MKLSSLLLLSIFLISSNSVFAEPPYLGFQFGQSRADLGPSLNERDAGFKLIAGWSFNPNLAAEISYTDFTEIGRASQPGFFSIESQGIAYTAQVAMPLTESFDLFARLGFLQWQSQINGNVGGNKVALTTDSGTDPVTGFGLSFRLSERFSLRAESEVYHIEGVDLGLLSFGVLYDF